MQKKILKMQKKIRKIQSKQHTFLVYFTIVYNCYDYYSNPTSILHQIYIFLLYLILITLHYFIYILHFLTTFEVFQIITL